MRTPEMPRAMTSARGARRGGNKMFRSSCQGRHRAHATRRKWLAAGLCAASFLMGQMVSGQEPVVAGPVAKGEAAEGNQPQSILNDYLAAKAGTAGSVGSALKPAAIQAVAELPLG